jgi:alpha-D-ribose 1-methylphosphonate 5-triphosphate synthase subunit PhnH
MSVNHPGFTAPVADAQSCFRAVLEAMSHPGRIMPVGAGLSPPDPLAPATAAVLLTLVDNETPVWLAPGLDAATDWMLFHCGAPLANPAQAAFAVCQHLPPLDQLGWGTHDGPEASATVILQLPDFTGGPRFRLSGPGLKGPETVCLGALPADFASRWVANRAAFPRGVDLILCAGDQVAALPRTVTVEAI